MESTESYTCLKPRVSLLMLTFAIGILVLLSVSATAQQPVVGPDVNIDQYNLTAGCSVATSLSCKYTLKKVLESGGTFYSTPFLPWDPKSMTGDGHGEGRDGPRSAQRHKFNPFNKEYPYLRLNGLDSQSCYECHNSIGSSHQGYDRGLMRKPAPVGGSAGFNSNAFINPAFPTDAHPNGPITLMIRNPPDVFGSGYTQELANEMTTQLWFLKAHARAVARMKALTIAPAPAYTQPLVVNGIDFGEFKTTYTGGPANIIATKSCPAAANPENIGGEMGFTDDVTGVKGVPCDLVVRPFQWKGVSSSVRHFARDALDFHFSIQAFEKFAMCDCDRDGLAPELGREPAVSIGNVSALVSFVTMMRPPVQAPLDTQARIGSEIFNGTYKGLALDGKSKSMCASCHTPQMRVAYPLVRVEWPTNANDSEGHAIDPKLPETWPISPQACPGGNPSSGNTCPGETTYGFGTAGALVTPSLSSSSLPIVRRIKIALVKQGGRQKHGTANFETLQVADMQSFVREVGSVEPDPAYPDYKIPLTPPAESLTTLQLPRLLPNPNGTINVPLFSDLKTHAMGSCLSDPTEWNGQPITPSGTIKPQGTDVNNIFTVPDQFLTRPLWGVADTGPWLHDGRARSLLEAILLHGDSAELNCTGSEAEPVINAFRHLSSQEQQDVVQFLLALRLPLPADSTASPTARK